MQVILISGKAGSGKDTFADLLTGHLHNAVIYALGDYVKDIAFEVGWDGKKDKKGRRLLQNIGTSVRRYNRDYWVNQLIDDIDEDACVIVTDVRYPNEIERIQDVFPDVTTIRLERFKFDNGLTEKQKMHDSETALDTYEFDYVIHNNTTLAALDLEAKYIAAQIES